MIVVVLVLVGNYVVMVIIIIIVLVAVVVATGTTMIVTGTSITITMDDILLRCGNSSRSGGGCSGGGRVVNGCSPDTRLTSISIIGCSLTLLSLFLPLSLCLLRMILGG